MKVSRLLAYVVALAFVSFATPEAWAQRGSDSPRPSPNATISQTIGTTVVDLHYSRPGVKGRTVFGDLVQWGEVWRAGANEPTTVTFSGPVQVEGKAIDAGTYNLFVRPQEGEAWDVILTTPVRWGTMFSDATPVLEVSATPASGASQEWLSYTFENLNESSADLVLHWADTRLPITISLGD